MNMKKVMSAFFSTVLLVSTATAGPIVNKLGKNAFNTQIAAGIEQVLGKHTQSAMLNPSVAFYQTYPVNGMLPLNDVSFVARSDDSNSVVMTDYVSIGAQAPGGSALGLRVVLAPHESRLEAARSMAESGLIKTGDIIICTRPLFANSLQYLALQLLNTHVSMAVVVNEGGRKVFYNLDMPMDAEFLGGRALGFGKSVLDSSGFVDYNDNLIFQVVRPRLDETQKRNMQAWLEKALEKARAKTVYPASISFNSDYNNPSYRENGNLGFVKDTARLLLGQKMKENKHMQMFCSEFAWTMLSLRNCRPDGSDLNSCVSEIFKPMQMLGSAFSGGQASDQSLYGMTDGIPALINATGASPQLAMNLIDFALPGVDRSASGLSSGHKAVASAMAPLISQMNGYFKLTLTRDAQQIDGARAQFNPTSPRNYSPTAFSVHAIMPSQINGKAVTQKKFDYVATLMYVPKARLKDLQSK